MEATFKFLLQASRLLSDGNYVDKDVSYIYDFLISVDNFELNEYFRSNTIFSYKNDLELYVEVVDFIISIYEEKEMFEKCGQLMLKKQIS